MDDRKHQMQVWLNNLGYDVSTLQTASADASFRRYFRVTKNGESYIVMDSPPDSEPCDTFVTLAEQLRQNGINAPKIFDKNTLEGYLVLSDFGDDLLLGLLNENTVNGLYGDALDSIIHMQKNMPTDSLPAYSAALLNTEMELFKEWFVEKLLGEKFDSEQEAQWQQAKAALVSNALEQPQVFVHRDYHSRNIIKTGSGALGIIDFQDAVKGAITYDVASLLRDCYVEWPLDDVNRWLALYYSQAKQQNLVNVSLQQLTTWFQLMGVQRHLKAIGIFSRLKLRDNKNGYIADIPRTLHYVFQASRQEPSLKGLHSILNRLSLLDKINEYCAH